jgi:hypothetical protein
MFNKFLKFLTFLFLLVIPILSLNLVSTSIDLAQSAYCPVRLDNNTNNILEYDINKNSMRAIVGFNKEYDSTFVSYRGSENIENWINNIKIKFTYPYSSFPNAGVELGFYKSYQAIYQDVINAITSTAKKYGSNSLLLTGHSLGGISTLLAVDIKKYYPEYVIKSLVTFGSPRIGNPNFVKMLRELNITSSRVTHHYDMVPHVPEERLGYQHIPSELWYNEKNSEFKECNDMGPESKEDDKCSNSCAPIHCTSINDHMNYLNVSMGINGDC